MGGEITEMPAYLLNCEPNCLFFLRDFVNQIVSILVCCFARFRLESSEISSAAPRTEFIRLKKDYSTE